MTLSGMSVLLAEDNPTNQMVATHMLESLGARVTLAQDGAEALEVCDGSRVFDVALIDIEMPRITGLDVIRRLRARRDDVAHMPMIALTAYVMREHRAAIEDAGADGIIAKPIVSIGKFGSEIMAHVRQRTGQAPSARPAPEPAAFDWAVFDELCSAFAPRGARELVGRIAEDIAGACETIAAAAVASDFEALRRATHSLMAVAGMIGAQRLRALSMRLNSAGQAEDDADIEEDASQLLVEAERVLKLVCCGAEETVE